MDASPPNTSLERNPRLLLTTLYHFRGRPHQWVASKYHGHLLFEAGDARVHQVHQDGAAEVGPPFRPEIASLPDTYRIRCLTFRRRRAGLTVQCVPSQGHNHDLPAFAIPAVVYYIPSANHRLKMAQQSGLSAFISELRRRRVFRVAAFYGAYLHQVYQDDAVKVGAGLKSRMRSWAL